MKVKHARVLGFIRGEFIEPANRLVLYLAIPAMVFRSISKASMGHQFEGRVVLQVNSPSNAASPKGGVVVLKIINNPIILSANTAGAGPLPGYPKRFCCGRHFCQHSVISSDLYDLVSIVGP